jgi:hypothetical protein
MTEAEHTGRLFGALMELGWQGITRFQMFGTEVGVGSSGLAKARSRPLILTDREVRRLFPPPCLFGGSREEGLKKEILFLLTWRLRWKAITPTDAGVQLWRAALGRSGKMA